MTTTTTTTPDVVNGVCWCAACLIVCLSMTENGKVLLDTGRSRCSVRLSVLLFPLLLLLFITRLRTPSSLLLVTLLLLLTFFSTLHSCRPSVALSIPPARFISSSKDFSTPSLLQVLLQPSCILPTKSSSCQQSYLTAAAGGPGQHSCHFLGATTSSSSTRSSASRQQHLCLFAATKSPAGPPPVAVNRTTSQSRRRSDKLFSSLLLRNRETKTCCCCCFSSTSTNSKSDPPPRQHADASLTRRFTPQKFCRNSRSTRRLSSGNKQAAAGSLTQPQTHVRSSFGSKSTGSEFWQDGTVDKHQHFFWKRVLPRMRAAASLSNWIREISPTCCLGYSLSSSRSGDSATPVGHLGGSFIASTVSTSALPTGSTFLSFFTRKHLLLVPHCCPEGSGNTWVRQRKGICNPDTDSKLQCCWRRSLKRDSTTTPTGAALKLPTAGAAYSSQKTLRCYVSNETEAQKCRNNYTLQIAGSCCCWVPAGASAWSQPSAGISAGFNESRSSSSRTKLLAGEREVRRGISSSTARRSCHTCAAAPKREGCSHGEDEYSVKERVHTISQLEKDLQGRHRAVGLAIKTGDAALAFTEFDKQLRCAAAAVRQWVLHHGRSHSPQLQDLHRCCCSQKPENVVTRSFLLQNRDLQHVRRKKQQHLQQQQHQQQQQEGQEDELEKQEETFGVERQEDTQGEQQQDVLVVEERWRRQSEGGICQHGHGGDLGSLIDENEAPVHGICDAHTSRQTQEDEGKGSLLVYTLMEPFIKSASGILNLCCKDESGEASSRSVKKLYMIARQVLRRLQEFDLLCPFNAGVGNAFLTAAAAAGDTEAVAATLFFMQQQGVRPQRKGYEALIRTLLRQGEGYCRLRQSNLLYHMLEQRLPPTPEQLFALILRDAARVRVQLKKEQQAVNKLKSLLHQQIPHQELLFRHESPHRQHGCAQHDVLPPPSAHTGQAAELKSETENNADTRETASLESSSPRHYTATAKFPGGDRNPSDLGTLPSTTQVKSNSEVHTAAVAAARAALIEEVGRSLWTLREFSGGIEDALLLLQGVVSEQLPLLSDKAASRFVAALDTLQFPAIAHISRVVVKHFAAGTTDAATADHNEHENLLKFVRQEDTPYREGIAPIGVARPPGAEEATAIATAATATAAPGDTRATRELFNVYRDETGDTQRNLLNEKLHDRTAVAQEKEDEGNLFFSETCSDMEAERDFVGTQGNDFLRQNDLQQHQRHAQQQQPQHTYLDRAVGTLEVPLPLNRSAVCAACGTRLGRVCLTSNERRLLRLGVLKLSAMLHPRQLRALLSFEAALSYRQLGLSSAFSNMTRMPTRTHPIAETPISCTAGRYQQHLLHREKVKKKECASSLSSISSSSSVSGGAVKTSGATPGGDQAAAAHHCPPDFGVAPVPVSFASAEQTGGGQDYTGRGESGVRTTNTTGEVISAVSKDTTEGEWRTRNEVKSTPYIKAEEALVRGHCNTDTNSTMRSVLPRYTVVLDAANIAYNSQNREEGVFSYPQIERVRQELLGRGERPLIILPSAYYWGFGKQRTKRTDCKAWKTKQTLNGDPLSERTTRTDHHNSSSSSSSSGSGSRSSSSQSILMRQLLHTPRPAERSKGTISEAYLPPEAKRMWLCRMGLCPLCIEEIHVPNRCKKSSRSSFYSQTLSTLPMESSCCIGVGTAGNPDSTGETEKHLSKNETTTDNMQQRGTVSSPQGGQRLVCLDRALLRLWEQEKCLFVCRSGAHDDHYHLLASLSACSLDSPYASSAAAPSLPLRYAGLSEGIIETLEKPVSAGQQAHAQPTGHTQQMHHEFTDLPFRCFHHCAKKYDLTAAVKRKQQQQQRTAKRSLYDARDGFGDGVWPDKGQQQGKHLSAEHFLNIMLGTQEGGGKHSSHRKNKEPEQLRRQTGYSPDIAFPDAPQSLWDQLWWRCGRSFDDTPPAASRNFRPTRNRVVLAGNTVADDRRQGSRVNQSATTFLGYSWDDFTCTREAINADGVQRMQLSKSATVSPDEGHYPVALLTNDRFRDHRLSSQQRIAFKHWRQLALLPYVFQRLATLNRSGFAVGGGGSPTESVRQHIATPFRTSSRQIYRGARYRQEHNTIDQQQDSRNAVGGDYSFVVASEDGSEGQIAKSVDTEAIDGRRLADDVETVGTRAGTYGKESVRQEMPRVNVFDEQKEGQAEDDKEASAWASRISQHTNFVKLRADDWDGRCRFMSAERHIDEWSVDDTMDIAAERVSNNHGKSTTHWASKKNTFYGEERFKRGGKRKRNVSKETPCGDYVTEEETEPLLFIGMLHPVTRRVQISLRKTNTGGLHGGAKLTKETPVELQGDPLARTTKPSIHRNTQGGLRVLSRALEQLVATGYSPGETAALSSLDSSSTCTPHEEDAVVWHIPLRRAENESFHEEDDLFATHSANLTAHCLGDHMLRRTSEHTLKEQEEALYDVLLPITSHNNVSMKNTRINTPNNDCTAQPTKTDKMSDRSAENKDLARHVFAEFDVLSQQNSGKQFQGEETSEESDAWLGIDLAPLNQVRRAREQFLHAVDQQVF